MYNKYSSMKKSELKEAIKAEIKSVLSEEITEAKFVKFKGDSDDMKMKVEAEREMNTPDGELKVYRVKTDDGVQSYTADQVELVEEDEEDQSKSSSLIGRMGDRSLKEGTWSSGTYNEIGRFIQDVKNLRDKYYDIVGNDDVFDGLDRAEEAAREMMINAPENKSDVTFDDIREAKSAADVDKEVKDLKAKMIEKAKEFKKSEGKAKDKIKDELKAMTVKKGDLEKKVEDLKSKEEEKIANKGKDQELDA